MIKLALVFQWLIVSPENSRISNQIKSLFRHFEDRDVLEIIFDTVAESALKFANESQIFYSLDVVPRWLIFFL